MSCRQFCAVMVFVLAAFVPPSAGQTGQVGGVGIAFLPNEDGKLEIKAILPGGPADKAKLRAGGVLVAVDGKDVDGMNPEQVRSLIAGTPGSVVKLTIETETEVSDVILQRAVIEQPGQQPAGPLRANQPPAIPNAGVPAAANAAPRDAQFPAWMKPGVRITWYVGSASIPGMSQTAVQDDNGNWIDPQTGQRYANADNPSTAGAGMLQFDVLQASDNFTAVNARNWLMLDVNGALTAGPITGYAGDAKSIGDYWIHPAALAAMPEQNQGGLLVRRRDYPLNGRNYKAIVIQNTAGGGFQRLTYDLDTGLLLVGSGRTIGAAQQQIGPGGQVYTGSGVTTITSTVLQDVRDLKLPWASDRAPQFVKQGWQIQYRGGQSTAIPGTEGMNIPPSDVQVVATATQVGSHAAVMKTQSSLQMPYGQPQRSEATRCVGAGMIGGMWLNPRSLAQLQPGAVIDDDRISRVRTTFQGVQNNVAAIIEQGANDAMAYYYDMQSGLLVGASSQQKSGVATITTQVQMVGQR